MIRKSPKKGCLKRNVTFEEAETIEEKIRKIIENNEPITDGAPIIYTEKKDGVLPQYDIRTDRWEIAQKAMDKVNASKIAQSKNYEEIKNTEKTEEMETTKTDNPKN